MLRGLEHKPCGIQESRSPGGDCYTFQGAGSSIFCQSPADRNDVEKLKQADAERHPESGVDQRIRASGTLGFAPCNSAPGNGQDIVYAPAEQQSFPYPSFIAQSFCPAVNASCASCLNMAHARFHLADHGNSAATPA